MLKTSYWSVFEIAHSPILIDTDLDDDDENQAKQPQYG